MSLKPIQHILENPNDVPDVPRLVKEYLQVVLNYSYLSKSNKLETLRASGFSEAYIAGFIAGCEHGSLVIDMMEIRNNRED
ncbi:hypothetical protein HOT56_gp18 [Escherichia phage SRT7]|uniref:Phage protein n=2 Tax=Foetvirus SRT7 TaxID=2733617 RepID=A0A2Z5H580_9CAUD|nr:hypothetical protein HOT56_gp18 [Escherichia phage SRT7]AXC34582.1 hypothetical protein [Escherichia phage SRT7]QKM75958.1 hypothetical protein ZD95_29 [Escherichia phage P1723]